MTPMDVGSAIRAKYAAAARAAEAAETQACGPECGQTKTAITRDLHAPGDMEHPEPTLRRAQAGEVEAVIALLEHSGLPVADIAEKIDGFVVAARGDAIVGVVALELIGESGLLRSLTVAAEDRGCGLGARLVDHAVARALLGGARELYLLTTTASGFFERHGFVRIPRQEAPAALRATTEFADLCPEAAVCMRRLIGVEAGYYPADSLQLTADVPGAAYWAMQLDHVMLTYFEVEPGTRFERHAHDAEQITMVLEGELVFECDERRPVRVRAGEVVTVPCCVPHAVFAGATRVKAVDAWSPPRRVQS